MSKKVVTATPGEVEQYAAKMRTAQSSPSSNPGNDPPGGDGPDAAAKTGQGAIAEAPPAEQARSEAEEYKDKYLRAVAELANYRKRSEKDREESLRYANVSLIRSLLNVLDNLDRVIASAREHPENTSAIVDGAKLTAETFHKVLREHNVSLIEAEGQPFDPVVHEAIMQQPSEQYDTPTVLKAVQAGYKLHDRVIRPARVIVSKPSGKSEE